MNHAAKEVDVSAEDADVLLEELKERAKPATQERILAFKVSHILVSLLLIFFT